MIGYHRVTKRHLYQVRRDNSNAVLDIGPALLDQVSGATEISTLITFAEAYALSSEMSRSPRFEPSLYCRGLIMARSGSIYPMADTTVLKILQVRVQEQRHALVII